MLRTPLGPRSGNSRRGPELTPYARGKIVGAAQMGSSPSVIAAVQNQSQTNIRNTLRLDLERNEGQSKPRSGRPKLYTDRDERRILRQVRLFPKCTYADVRKACAITLCNTTLKTILSKHSISNWRAKRRPELTEEVAAKRLAWCLLRKDWGIEEYCITRTFVRGLRSPLNVLVELLFPSAKTIFIIDDRARVTITLAIFIIDDGVRVMITLHSTLALGAFLIISLLY
jgi:hypothetical protein